ncbi:MAG TPA: DUF4097 family beta strand repeat-containing protein [Acidimicrobiia bacterium]|jgi:DUF4097 and DUF4098 domain-containing protein YvlB
MTDQRQELVVDGPAVLDVTTYSGDIVLSDGQEGVLTVRVSGNGADRFTIEQRGNVVAVAPDGDGRGLGRRTSAGVTAEVPRRTEVELRSSSGNVIVQTTVGSAKIQVASGDVKMRQTTGDVSVKSASGDLYLGSIGGALRAQSASGDVRADDVGGDCMALVASGDIFIGSVAGRIDVKTASGDATFRDVQGDDFVAKTLSGNVRIGVPGRRIVEVDLHALSGSIKSNLTERDSGAADKTLTITVNTVSGDVYLLDA